MTAPFSTKERALAGAVVTVVNTQTGETKAINTTGIFHEYHGRDSYRWRKDWFGLTEQLRELCDRMDTWDGDWKVRCISSPQTILADIQGRKAGGRGDKFQFPQRPEISMLRNAGRIDMLEGGLKC